MRLPVLIAALVLLAGCGGIERFAAPEAGPPIPDLRVLNGGFAGDAVVATGDRCEAEYRIVLAVADGRVRGEVSTPKRPNAAPSIFETYVDIDGWMSAPMYMEGGVLYLQGRFRPDRFTAMIQPENTLSSQYRNETRLQLGRYAPCRWIVNMARTAG
jgi:hypothetical protein